MAEKISAGLTDAIVRSLLAVVLSLACVSESFAAGTEWTGRQDDLQISVDSRWAGCKIGGYYPIRIRLRNYAEARRVTVTFQAQDSGMPNVSRTVDLAQNASASTSLLVPMVGLSNYGNIVVEADGDDLDELNYHMSIADPDLSGTRLSLLAISETTVDCLPFEAAVSSQFAGGGSGSGGYYYGMSHGSANEDNETIQPTLLPDTWIAYSGLDLVVISRSTFEEKLTHENRTALLNWVRANGTLIINEAGSSPGDDSDFNKLLGFDKTSRPGKWQAAQVQQRRTIPIVEIDDYGNKTSSSSRPSADDVAWAWEASPDAFAIRDLGLGKIVSFKGDVFTGTQHEWAWLLKSAGERSLRLADRMGVAGRSGNGAFLDFLIPGIQSVPVMAFLIFISVFAFIIGPLNYFMLARRKRLNLLVVTIPGVALITSLLLFSYSAVAHGFSVKSRVRSVTVLDQDSQKAVSVARLALYAGFTPSDGLKFSPNTAVTPIWPENHEFGKGYVDWTETQNLRTGFLRSRTRTQFLTTSVRDERGRLNIESAASGLNVANGLEWDLAALIVKDSEGNLFYGKDLAAGASAKLDSVSDADREFVKKLLLRSQPARPEELDGTNDISVFDEFSRSRYYYRRHSSRTYHVSSEGELERQIQSAQRAVDGKIPMENNSYIAIVKKNPEKPPVEYGTETSVVDDWHLVIGYF